MSNATWITMGLMLAFVWGGFLIALGTAIRKESRKTGPGEAPGSPP